MHSKLGRFHDWIISIIVLWKVDVKIGPLLLARLTGMLDWKTPTSKTFLHLHKKCLEKNIILLTKVWKVRQICEGSGFLDLELVRWCVCAWRTQLRAFLCRRSLFYVYVLCAVCICNTLCTACCTENSNKDATQLVATCFSKSSQSHFESWEDHYVNKAQAEHFTFPTRSSPADEFTSSQTAGTSVW